MCRDKLSCTSTTIQGSPAKLFQNKLIFCFESISMHQTDKNNSKLIKYIIISAFVFVLVSRNGGQHINLIAFNSLMI